MATRQEALMAEEALAELVKAAQNMTWQDWFLFKTNPSWICRTCKKLVIGGEFCCPWPIATKNAIPIPGSIADLDQLAIQKSLTP